MKRLIIICSVLALFSIPLFAAENNIETAQQSSAEAVEQQVRIITGIHLDSFVFGRDTYQTAENIEYYSEDGGRVTKAHFHEHEGVLLKLNSDNKIFYMKKMPY